MRRRQLRRVVDLARRRSASPRSRRRRRTRRRPLPRDQAERRRSRNRRRRGGREGARSGAAGAGGVGARGVAQPAPRAIARARENPERRLGSNADRTRSRISATPSSAGSSSSPHEDLDLLRTARRRASPGRAAASSSSRPSCRTPRPRRSARRGRACPPSRAARSADARACTRSFSWSSWRSPPRRTASMRRFSVARNGDCSSSRRRETSGCTTSPPGHVLEQDQDRVGREEGLGHGDALVGGVVEAPLEPLRRGGHRRVERERDDVARERADALRAHRVALVGHGGRADLAGLERLFELAVVLQQAQVGADLVRRLREARERVHDRVVLLARIGLARDELPPRETGAPREGGVELLDLRGVAVEEQQEGGLACRSRPWLRGSASPRGRRGSPRGP